MNENDRNDQKAERSVSKRDLPLDIARGDGDLKPVAVLLWLASVVLVVLTFVHHRVFDVEATLATLCVVLIPVGLLKARR